MSGSNNIEFVRDTMNLVLKLLATYQNLPANLVDYQYSVLLSISGILEMLGGSLFELVSQESDPTIYVSPLSGDHDNIIRIAGDVEKYLEYCLSILNPSVKNEYIDVPFTAMATDAQTLVFRINECLEKVNKS